MLTTKFEIAVAIAAFILGATEGGNIWAWIKSWFVKEVVAVETKVGILPTGTSGTSGPTGAH